LTDLLHVSGREKLSRISRLEAYWMRTESHLTWGRTTKKRIECRSRQMETGQEPAPSLSEVSYQLVYFYMYIATADAETRRFWLSDRDDILPSTKERGNLVSLY
jgi:hypothetical protein